MYSYDVWYSVHTSTINDVTELTAADLGGSKVTDTFGPAEVAPTLHFNVRFCPRTAWTTGPGSIRGSMSLIATLKLIAGMILKTKMIETISFYVYIYRHTRRLICGYIGIFT